MSSAESIGTLKFCLPSVRQMPQIYAGVVFGEVDCFLKIRVLVVDSAANLNSGKGLRDENPY